MLKPADDRELELAIAFGLFRHRAEQRVRRMEKWFATTLTSIGDGVVAADLHGSVTYMNAMAERLTEWDFDSGRHRHIHDVVRLIDETDLSEIEIPMAQVIAGEVVIGLSARTALCRRSGSRLPIDESASPIRDEHDHIIGVVIVFRDVTEQRRLADELRQTQKLEAVGRLAGGVAHEFNNLMTVVLGNSELLANDSRLDDGLREPVKDIWLAGQRAAVLTRQLLTFGRKQVFQSRPIDVNVCISEIAGMLKRLIGDHVTLETRLDAAPAIIKADRGQLEQAIVNLAANGRDAMPSGGTLTITTRTEPSTVVVEVSDTGTGMNNEVLDHLFEPFFTTKAVGQGTGLGLAAVHGAVTSSGGRIQVDSVVGRGSRFSISFPALQGVAASDVPSAPAVSFDGRGQTALVVDDEPSVRELVARILARTGLDVIEAHDARDALQKARDHGCDLHLLVTDIVTPSGSGVELARRLATTYPTMKTILMSGYAERALVPLRSGDVGAVFVQKPFAPTELLARVRDLLSPRKTT